MNKVTTIFRTTAAAFFVLTLAAFMLIGCSGGNSSSDAPGESSAGQAAAATRTITDALGREVEIPSTVERIVPLGNTPRMIAYLQLADKVVGISGIKADEVQPTQAYAYAYKDVWADLPVVGTDAAGATDYYPEQIISVDPDVILCTYTAELADEIQGKTGIPVVAVPMGTLYGSDYDQALRILGDVCGAEERAEEVIAYIRACLDDLSGRTEGVSADDKPSVLGAAATFKGKHGIEGVYVNYPVFTAIHANDVAEGPADGASAFVVDKEQILGWDPDLIFLDAGNVGLVRDDMAKNPDFFERLSAFKSGSVYRYPNSSSYFSNVEIPIVNSYYVASLIYPEQFEDVSFEDKASEVFGFFLGDPDYLAKLEAGGYGYGKADLGGN